MMSIENLMSYCYSRSRRRSRLSFSRYRNQRTLLYQSPSSTTATEGSPQPVVVGADGTVKLAISDPILAVGSNERSLTVTLVVATVSIAANVCLLTIIGVLSLAPIGWKQQAANNSISLTIPEELCSTGELSRFFTLSVRSKSCAFTCQALGGNCLQHQLNNFTPDFLLSVLRKMNINCIEVESKRWSSGQPWADFRKYPYEGRAQCSGMESNIESECDAATSASANRLCLCSHNIHQDGVCPDSFPFEINDTCYRIEKSLPQMHGALAARKCVEDYSGELPILHNLTVYEDFIDRLRNCVDLASGRFFLGLQAQGQLMHWDYSSKLNFIPEWGTHRPRMDPIHRRIYVESDNKWYDMPEFETLDETTDLVCQALPLLYLPGAESRATFQGVRGRLSLSCNESNSFAASEPVDCASLCRASPTCLSFSFDYRLRTTKACFLHSFSSYYSSGLMEQDEGVFFERDDITCLSCSAATPPLDQIKLECVYSRSFLEASSSFFRSSPILQHYEERKKELEASKKLQL